MSFPALPLVNVSGVSDMGIGKAPSKGICFFGNCYKMSMISHQAVSPDFYSVLLTGFFQKFYIVKVIIVTEEYVLSAIASLDDMVGILRYNDSCYSCHNWLKAIPSCLFSQDKLVAVPDYLSDRGH